MDCSDCFNSPFCSPQYKMVKMMEGYCRACRSLGTYLDVVSALATNCYSTGLYNFYYAELQASYPEEKSWNLEKELIED